MYGEDADEDEIEKDHFIENKNIKAMSDWTEEDLNEFELVPVKIVSAEEDGTWTVTVIQNNKKVEAVTRKWLFHRAAKAPQ